MSAHLTGAVAPHNTSAPRPTRVTSRLALLVVAGPVAFALAWLIAGLWQPGFRPWRDDESALAATGAAHPWLTMTGDTAIGLATLALGVALGVLPAGRRRATGRTLLVVAGVAIVVQALVREDCVAQLGLCPSGESAAQTWRQSVHDTASLVAFLAILIAMLVLVRPMREGISAALARRSKIAGIAGFVILVGYTALSDSAVGGLAELVFLVVPVTWIALCGITLRNLARTSPPGQ